MHVAVTAARLPLVCGLPPVEHVGHVQLAFAHGLVVGTADEVREVMRAFFLIAEDAPRKRYVVCTLHHVGVAVLAVPEFAVVNPDVLGAVVFDGEVVPRLVGSAARDLDDARYIRL